MVCAPSPPAMGGPPCKTPPAISWTTPNAARATRSAASARPALRPPTGSKETAWTTSMFPSRYASISGRVCSTPISRAPRRPCGGTSTARWRSRARLRCSWSARSSRRTFRRTPVEVLGMEYPWRLTTYVLRRGSGGVGQWAGGDGVIREFAALAPMELSVLAERRRHGPAGAGGGGQGAAGRTILNGTPLAPKASTLLQPGDVLRIETPGGGGWGTPEQGDAR